MKKAMLIFIISAMLTACGNVADMQPAVNGETMTVSHTAKEESYTTASKMTEAAVSSTYTKSSTAAETTSTSKITTTTKTETDLPKTTTTRQQTQQTKAQTHVTYYYEPAPETQQYTEPEVTVTESRPTTTTTVHTTPPPATTTPAPTAPAAPSGITWSDSMKVWRKLCEGKRLSGSEQDIIRNEILDYAVSSFNGKKDIHVSFGIDEYDISYEKPLNLKIRSDMKDMSYAHMDAYADADCSWLIDYASSEQEIYDIVSDTRQSCLHVIDYGLFNRWEIYSINGVLKYASDIEFNVGFEDTAIWFLTED